jgi:hypothetical protein
LQFGLQFNTVPRRPGQTDQGRWTSLNQSGQRRPELLMRLGLTEQLLGPGVSHNFLTD